MNYTKNLAFIGVMTAITCILGPLSIPIGPVPISFTNLSIYLSVILLGKKYGTISYMIYLLLGLFGLPVFSGFTGGAGKLFGPTGGYLIGFLLMALVSGWFVEKFHDNFFWSAIGMLLGSMITYLFGSLWLAYQASIGIKAALFAGVIPFIPGDLIKIILAVWMGPIIKKRLKKAAISVFSID